MRKSPKRPVPGDKRDPEGAYIRSMSDKYSGANPLRVLKTNFKIYSRTQGQPMKKLQDR